MEHRHAITIGTALVAITMFVSHSPGQTDGKNREEYEKQGRMARGTAQMVARELATIANLIALRPDIVVDATHVSGEYCFQAGGGITRGGHMTHFATDPLNTQEDVVDFINAEQLIEAGLDPKKLPQLPSELGQMKPNQWYFLPPGEKEPHHGRFWPVPVIIRAIDVKPRTK